MEEEEGLSREGVREGAPATPACEMELLWAPEAKLLRNSRYL